VGWRAAEENVRRLRQRIFMASQAGDPRRVRNLRKLMLRSGSGALVSVRRVTEVNAGRKTAGVDGRVVPSSSPPSSPTCRLCTPPQPPSGCTKLAATEAAADIFSKAAHAA
jgi:hypothetical protein